MKPILFNTESVKAILDGLKSVTRRVVKPQPTWSDYDMAWHWKNIGWWRESWNPIETSTYKNTIYRPGDLLYVREAFAEMPYGYVYRADEDEPEGWDCNDRWLPSIHMPKEAARLFLRVTDVRVERLQGITPEQLRAEGIEVFLLPSECQSMLNRFGAVRDFDEKKKEFAKLWDSAIKKADLPQYGWDANPWVWVIEFNRISKEDAIK